MATKTIKNVLSWFVILFPIVVFSLKRGVVGDWYILIIIISLGALSVSNYLTFKDLRKTILATLIPIIVALTFIGIVYFRYN
ncbi:hypothetical protein [Spirosoma endbachense]|uniref:Uncharacterized protein n=1 Tax=Spirosoma endbachense TaxID=2666025 RepID=A0A6P1VQZ2_9BACT|nr:hypothetical protein [Spirosoma endbachense]QHV94019.1 hypothetical protein GJR95_02800 [Spirosoma endbachense]